jgi:hypothetical protein
MATYYKYQNPSEIGAAPTLDWGTVISNVNQNLQNQEQQRYENREADKKLTNDILTKANEITASSDPNFGAILQKTADQMKNNTFNRYNLLKQGKISRSDYSIFNQNASSSIAQLDSFSKNWNGIYTAALDLRKKGLTTDLSNALQDVLGGFQNFTDKKLVQGNDGFLNTATIDPNTGKVLDNSLGILPMQAMTNVKNFTDLRINLQDAANKYAKDIKPFIISEKTGKVLTREDILKRPGYTDFLDNAFNGIAVNDNVIADILTTYGDYKTDLNLKDSDNASKKITAKQSNGAFVSDITPEMRKEAKEIFEKQLLYQVKSEETPMPVFSPSRGTGGGKGKKEVVTTTNDISLAGGRTMPESGELTGVANFTIKQTAPIVDMSTGLKRKLKNIYFDTENPNNIRMLVQIQDKDDPTKTKDVSYSSFKRTEKIPSTRPGGKPRYVEQSPDLAELNNFATKIYSPELGRYLEDWTELAPILQQRGQSVRKTKTSNTTSKTISYMLDGVQYNIPNDEVQAFLKDNPKAKRK